MKCLECQDLLQRRLDGERVGVETELESHLAGCPACREQHAAASVLLRALGTTKQPEAAPRLTARIVEAVARDRVRRRQRAWRSLLATAALVGLIFATVVTSIVNQPGAPVTETPTAQVPEQGPRSIDAPLLPNQEAGPALAALGQRLAGRAEEHVQVLWTAANPLDGLQVGPLPDMQELSGLPPPESLSKAGEEVRDSVQTVTRSAQQALAYFSRELPVLETSMEN